MRISDWSSDVCSSDLRRPRRPAARQVPARIRAPPENRRTLMPRWFTSLACLLLFAASFAAQAQVRAWIDRDQVALGETLTLNVEPTDTGSRAPAWSPLATDFIVSQLGSASCGYRLVRTV